MADHQSEDHSIGVPGNSSPSGAAPVARTLTVRPSFSVRLVTIDYYMARPLQGVDVCYSHFQGTAVAQVPVVRIFGSTPGGQKTCLHLHQAFPYFYVPYEDTMPQDLTEALAHVRRFASAVEKAMKLTSSVSAKRQHVHGASLVRGHDIYGYHPAEQLFIKVVLYYPQEVSRVATILQSGAILGRRFQAYEAHIPYLLQVMVDYNLVGMAHVHFSRALFRSPVPARRASLTRPKFGRAAEAHASPEAQGGPVEADLGASGRKAGRRRHRYSLDGASIKIEYEQDESQVDRSGPVGSPASSLEVHERERPVYVQGTVAADWIWGAAGGVSQAGGQSRVPVKQSCCELEADAAVEDILNRQELLSVPLEQAPPQMKLVQSLIPIWEDETRRSLAAGRPPPATPTSADDSPRVPQPPTDVEVRLRRAVYKLAEEEEALLGKRHGASPAEEEPGGAEQGPGQAEAADTPGTAAGGDGRREASQEPSPIGSAEESGRAGSQRLQAGEGTRESQPRDQRSVLAGPALPESPGPPTPVPPPGASPLFGSSQQPQRSPFTPASGLVRVFGSQPGGSQRSSQGARNQDSLFTLTQAANQAKTAGDKSPLDDMGLASPDDWRGGGGATQELGGGRSPAFKRSRFSQEEGDHSTKTAGSKALDFSGTAEEDEEGLVDEAIMTQVTQGFSKGVESADRDLYEALAGLGGSDDEERGEEGWAERGENRGFSRPVQKWKGKTTKEEGESSQELLDILEMLGAQDGRKETGEGLGEKAADVSRSRGGGVDVGPQDRREVDGEGADERAADVSRLRGGGPMQSDERGWLGKVGMEEEDAESGEEASVRYSRQEGGVGRETDNRNDKQGKGPAVNVGRPTAFAAPLRKPKTEPEEADSLGQSIQSGGDRFPGFPGSWQGQGFGPKVKTEKKEGGEAGVLNASVPKRDRAGQQLSLREQMRRQRDRRPTGAAKLVGREHKKEKRGEQDKSISGVDPGRESTSVRDSTQVAEASKAAKAARFGGLSFGATKGGVVQLRTPKQETDIADRHRQGVPEARDGAQQKRHSAVPAFEAGGLSETTLGGSQRGRDSRGSDVRAAALEAAAVLQVSGSKRRSESSEQPEGNKLVRVKREALSPQPEPSRSQGPSSHPPDGPILDSAESQRSFKAVSEEPASGGTGQPGRAALSLSAQSAESPSRSEEANEANDLADLKLAVELGLSGREESLETEWDGTETGEDKLVQSPARDTPKFYHDMLPNDQLRLDGRANDFTGGVAEGYTAAGGPETADGSVQAEGTAHAEDTGPGFASQHLATAKLESEGPDDMEAESPSESVSDWGSSGGSEGEGASRAYDDLRLAEELGLFKGELAPDAGDAARVKTEPGVSEELEGAEEVGVGGEEKGTERGKEGSLPGAGGEAKPVLRFVKVEPTEDEDLKPGLHLDEGLYRIVSPPSERAAVKPETEGLLEEEEWQNEPDLSADPGALSGRRAVSADAGATEGLPIGEASVEDEKQRPVTNTARMSPAGTEGAEGRSSADRDLNQGDQPLSRSQSPKMKEEVDRSKEVETTPPSPFRSSGESPHLAQPSPLSPAKPSASPHESFSPKVGKASELALVVSGKAAEPENGGAGSGGTFVWRYGKAAPSAAQLRDTWQQHGLHEHAYGGAFYGNPKDVPERSAIFAGLEFNLRSRAVADLPPVPFARTSARPTSRALALPGNPIVPPGGYVSAPLRPPPSRAAVERWLVRKQRREERRKRRAARAARGPAAFRMNPNTGALIPVTTQKGGDASQASGGTDEGLEGQPDATPQSESSGSSGGSESEEGGAEQEEIVRPASPKYDEAQGLGTPLFAAGPSQRRRTSIASARQSQRRSAAGESQAEPLRPTSPKYDEAHGLSLPYLAPRGAPKRTFIQSSIPISVTQPAQTNRGPAFGMTSPPLQSPSFRSKPPPSPAHRGVGGFDKAGSRTPQSKTPLPFQRTLQPGESIPLPVSNITDVPQTPNPQQSRRANTEVPVPDSHTPQHQAVRKDSNVGHSNAPAATSLETARQDNSASNGDLPLGGRPPSESPFKIPPPPVRANSIVSSPKGQAPIPSSTTKPAITSQGTPPTLMQHSDVTRVGPGATSATGVPSPTSPGPTLGTLGPTMVSPKRDRSQITPPSPVGGGTPVSQVGFRDPAIAGGGQQLTLMSIEMHAASRGDLRPDPRYDAVGCVVVCIMEDGASAAEDAASAEPSGELQEHVLVLIVDEPLSQDKQYRNLDALPGCEVIYLPSELSLLHAFVAVVRAYDPDILAGWEVQNASVGYLAERAAHLGLGLLKALSRTPPGGGPDGSDQAPPSGAAEVAGGGWAALGRMDPATALEAEKGIIEDEWGRTHASGIHVVGRVVLNLWRLMRGEIKLHIYSLEAVADAVLRRKIPSFPWRTLSGWFARGVAGGRWRCVRHVVERARLNFDILDQLDFVNRTSELARVFGIDFFSVLNRGSQYRVESMLLRLARSQNYLAISPSRRHVAEQPAMEALPLVMEPESRFYTDPVLVLDFQSLYPSMIIAYNLCFSTCLGRIARGNPRVLGITQLYLAPGTLPTLKDDLILAPNGIMYAPPKVRPGVLPRLLHEILTTRIMVKAAMKRAGPGQRVLQRIQNARQFALKLIANVTYGYTAAGFSGRMPCAELADSIVQCGRYTLERAIHMVESEPRWDARVVYGDTDSMFVLLKGRSRADAHRIGAEIAAAVTAANPPPVRLQIEKVYHPCMLITKKRYVGYMYESPDQKTPTFDAKGIETVRRDSCPAVAKTMERSLRLLFETRDLSVVKLYLQRQLDKILAGRVSVHDFVFAKEVRLGSYSPNAAVLPPAAIVASKAMAKDPRAEPKYAERIRYVVVHGEPGARLVDMVVDPSELLARWGALRLHGPYYITKQILPALQRLFGLVGADLRAWYAEMPKVHRPPPSKRPARNPPVVRWGDFGHVPNGGNGGHSAGPPGKEDEDAAEGAEWAMIGAANAVDLISGGGRGRSSRRGGGGTIDQYYLSRHCAVCSQLTRAAETVCKDCAARPQMVGMVLTGRAARLEKEYAHLVAICDTCGGADGSHSGKIACTSLDCGVYYERAKVEMELLASAGLASQFGTYSGINRFV